MPCLSQTIRVTTIVFNGINHTPLSSTAMIKLGGQIADNTIVDNAGKAFSSSKMEPAEVEFEVPLIESFDPDVYRGECGDLQILTSAGASYLVTNAQCSASIEIKDGESKVKLSFKGDAATVY